jgi:hypothetical protein
MRDIVPHMVADTAWDGVEVFVEVLGQAQDGAVDMEGALDGE